MFGGTGGEFGVLLLFGFLYFLGKGEGRGFRGGFEARV